MDGKVLHFAGRFTKIRHQNRENTLQTINEQREHN